MKTSLIQFMITDIGLAILTGTRNALKVLIS